MSSGGTGGGGIILPSDAFPDLGSAWTQLKAWAAAEWSAVEGGVETVIKDVEPIIEADIVAALQAFGSALVKDAVQLLSGGLPAGQTISQVADNLVMKVEAQGSAILQSTAVAAGGQVVSAAQAQLGAMAVMLTAPAAPVEPPPEPEAAPAPEPETPPAS